MAKELKIEVHKRDVSPKKSYLKTMRDEDKVPGIYYSFDSKESVPLYIDKKIIKEAGQSGTKIFNITVADINKSVIFKSIQYHPVTDEIIHVDLYGVNMKRAVVVKVGINLIGTAKGVLEEGGVLIQSLNEMEIECLPLDIPDSLEVDISELAIGDSIKLNDIEIDEKLNIKTALDQTIASVTHAMKEEEIVAPEAEEDEEFIEEGDEKTGDEQDKEEENDKKDAPEDKKAE